MKKFALVCIIGLFLNCFLFVQNVNAISITQSEMEYPVHEDDWVGYDVSMTEFGIWNYTNLGIDEITATVDTNINVDYYGLGKIIEANKIDRNIYIGIMTFVNKTNQPIFSTIDSVMTTHWQLQAISGTMLTPTFSNIASAITFGYPMDLTLREIFTEENLNQDFILSRSSFFYDYMDIKDHVLNMYINTTEQSIEFPDENTIYSTTNITLSLTNNVDGLESYNLTLSVSLYAKFDEDHFCTEFSNTLKYFQNRTTENRQLLTFYNSGESRLTVFHKEYSLFNEGWFIGTLISSILAGWFIAIFIYQYFSNKKTCETSPMEVCKRYTKYTKYQ